MSLVNAGQVCREKAVLRAKRHLLGLVLMLSLSWVLFLVYISYQKWKGRLGILRPRSKKALNDLHANKKIMLKWSLFFILKPAADLPFHFLWVCGVFCQYKESDFFFTSLAVVWQLFESNTCVFCYA